MAEYVYIYTQIFGLVWYLALYTTIEYLTNTWHYIFIMHNY
jgi:hypothetical protein